MNYKVKEVPANVDMFSNESDENLVPQYWFIFTEKQSFGKGFLPPPSSSTATPPAHSVPTNFHLNMQNY